MSVARRTVCLTTATPGKGSLGEDSGVTEGNELTFEFEAREFGSRLATLLTCSFHDFFQGNDRDADAVTVLAGTGGRAQLVDFSSTPAQLIDRLCELLTVVRSAGIQIINTVLLVISPGGHGRSRRVFGGGRKATW